MRCAANELKPVLRLLEIAKHRVAEHLVAVARLVARVRAVLDARRREIDEALGLGDRQRPKQHLVEQREDGRVRADAECEREHRDDRDEGRLEERAEGESEVVHVGVVRCATKACFIIPASAPLRQAPLYENRIFGNAEIESQSPHCSPRWSPAAPFRRGVGSSTVSGGGPIPTGPISPNDAAHHAVSAHGSTARSRRSRCASASARW